MQSIHVYMDGQIQTKHPGKSHALTVYGILTLPLLDVYSLMPSQKVDEYIRKDMRVLLWGLHPVPVAVPPRFAALWVVQAPVHATWAVESGDFGPARHPQGRLACRASVPSPSRRTANSSRGPPGRRPELGRPKGVQIALLFEFNWIS